MSGDARFPQFFVTPEKVDFELGTSKERSSHKPTASTARILEVFGKQRL